MFLRSSSWNGNISNPPNLIRLFYGCPRTPEYASISLFLLYLEFALGQQCEFFCWFDELLPRHKELEEQIRDLDQLRSHEKSIWEQEKSELLSKLSTLQAKLDDIKEKIRIANESDLMPPLDRLSIADEDDQSIIDVVDVMIREVQQYSALGECYGEANRVAACWPKDGWILQFSL
ncbi:hypothetical protein REPUB_Repub01dG0194100 [Reevesia pubescens]